MSLLDRIRDMLASIYGPMRPLNDMEKWEYLGEPTECTVCGGKLKFFPYRDRLRYICPSGLEGHDYFVFDRAEWEVQ